MPRIGTSELLSLAANQEIEITALQASDDLRNALGSVGTDYLQVDIVAALPAGSNAIGKLAANSGVDIGDVDVTSLPATPAGTNKIGSVDIAGTTKTLLQAVISFATAADQTIVTADATKKIKVVSLRLTVAGETNLIFKRAATAISGAMDFGGTSEPRGMVDNGTIECPILETDVNEAFVITNSAAIQVSGWIRYYLEA